LFFEAFDPKPANANQPCELKADYTVTPCFKNEPVTVEGPLTVSLNLPVAAKPTQTPKLVSAGVALSPYTRADDYSYSKAREQAFWLEFEQEPTNPLDAYSRRSHQGHSSGPICGQGRFGGHATACAYRFAQAFHPALAPRPDCGFTGDVGSFCV
jgi:hypothetical protein